MSTPRAVWVGSLLLTLTACQPRDAALSLRFETAATRTASAAIVLRIIDGGCTGTPIYLSAFPTSDPASATTPPLLPRGTYGFDVEARDGSCAIVAATCVTRELPLDQGTLEILVPDVAPSPACDPSQCTRGICSDDRPPDGGVPPDEDGGMPPACSGDGECPDGRCRASECCFGCWTGSSCEAGGSASACGSGGEDCATCTGEQTCVANACVSGPAVQLSLSPVTSYLRVGGGLWSAGSNASAQRGELVSAMANVFSRQDTALSFVDVGASQQATCGIDSTGALHCWGANSPGLLGIGSSDFTLQRPTPQEVGSDRWLDVEGGNQHLCAIREDGALHCWGRNTEGQAGSTGSPKLSPSAIEGGGSWSSVAPGDVHTCAIRADGALFCWGSNALGQLGAPGAAGGPTPEQVGTATDWIAVSTGPDHTCGIRGDVGGGELFCWGTQDFGRLGDGTPTSSSSGSFEDAPVSIDATESWVDVAAGQYHTCALTAAGAVFCWGLGTRGGTGLDTPGGESSVPMEVTALDIAADALAVGWQHTCAIAFDGATLEAVRCWGEGTDGRLGSGAVGDETMPITPTLDPSP